MNKLMWGHLVSRWQNLDRDQGLLSRSSSGVSAAHTSLLVRKVFQSLFPFIFKSIILSFRFGFWARKTKIELAKNTLLATSEMPTDWGNSDSIVSQNCYFVRPDDAAELVPTVTLPHSGGQTRSPAQEAPGSSVSFHAELGAQQALSARTATPGRRTEAGETEAGERDYEHESQPPKAKKVGDIRV